MYDGQRVAPQRFAREYIDLVETVAAHDAHSIAGNLLRVIEINVKSWPRLQGNMSKI